MFYIHNEIDTKYLTDNLFYFIKYIYAETGHERLCKYNAFVFKEKLQCDQSYPKSKTKQ